MKAITVIPTLTLALGLAGAGSLHAQSDPWTFDVTLYGLAAGMSGDVTVRGVNADVDVGFDKIWDNLEFGGMGRVRVGYEAWSFNVDVIYMGLGGSKAGVSVDMDQWVAEPSVGYTIAKGVEVLAGARYNNLSGDIRGPFGVSPAGTQDWWDPIIGAIISVPFANQFSFNVRGDVGGFGIGSDLTWQAFPSVTWHISRSFSLEAGYRWVYTDYDDGPQFRYDILTQGPQLGATFRF